MTKWTDERITEVCFAEFITQGLRLMKVEDAISIMCRMRDELTAERDGALSGWKNVLAISERMIEINATLTVERDQLREELRIFRSKYKFQEADELRKFQAYNR